MAWFSVSLLSSWSSGLFCTAHRNIYVSYLNFSLNARQKFAVQVIKIGIACRNMYHSESNPALEGSLSVSKLWHWSARSAFRMCKSSSICCPRRYRRPWSDKNTIIAACIEAKLWDTVYQSFYSVHLTYLDLTSDLWCVESDTVVDG